MSVWELDKALEPPILAYYDTVAPLMEHSFAGAPIVYGNYPFGFGHSTHFRVLGVPLSARKLLWACHRYYAVEFHTWAPLPTDEDRLRFARILIEIAPGTTEDTIREAATAVRAPDLPVCTPIDWAELATIANGSITAQTITTRLQARGDLFAQQAERLAPQRFADVQPRIMLAVNANATDANASTDSPAQSHGHMINAAIEILGDGKVRSADELLAAALERNLVPPTTNKKYVYTALIGYIADCCALVGHAYSEDLELQGELRTHGVADVAAYVREAGWSAQVTAAAESGRATAPHFNEGAAMIAVDDALRKAGSAQACTRDEVRLAFAYLTNPMTAAAVWADDTRTSIVILSPPES